MFQKHTTTLATGGVYERSDSPSGYYRIWEIANERYIDTINYVPWLNWVGTPSVVDVNPIAPPDPGSPGSWSFNPDGWIGVTELWAYASADSPTFSLSIDGDRTNIYAVGMKLKLTQTSIKYFIVTNVAYSSPNTILTLYGGTEYTLTDATITATSYSTSKAPHGFPINPSLWSVTVSSTTDRTTSTPTANTKYNGESVNIPIGVWSVYYQGVGKVVPPSSAVGTLYVTLSTANNTESDKVWTSFILGTGVDIRCSYGKLGSIVLTSKATYYFNYWTNQPSMSTIALLGDAISPTQIIAGCAYL